MTTIETIMDRIKSKCPSFKADVYLKRSCGKDKWEAQVCDVWGHVHTPTFLGNDAIKVIQALESFIEKMVNDLDDTGFVDNEGKPQGGLESAYVEVKP